MTRSASNPTQFRVESGDSGGFTMIELVSAMVGAALLMVGLAAALLVTGRSLEAAATPNTRSELLNTVVDRIADDARHATSIQQTGQSITINMSDRDGDGLNDFVLYTTSNAGLQRTQSLNPAVTFLTTSPTIALRVDGYTAPTLPAASTPVRLLGWTQAANTSRTTSLSVPLPSGTRSGDLLVLIMLGDDTYVTPNIFFGGSGWSNVKWHEDNGLYVTVYTRTATSTELTSQTVYGFLGNSTSIAATALCFSGQGRSAFNDHVSISAGFANTTTGSGVPGPLQISTIPDDAMNLQILALEGNPLAATTSGLAGFSDVSITTATRNGGNEVTLVTAIRNGKFDSPVASTYTLATSSSWAQVAIQWWP